MRIYKKRTTKNKIKQNIERLVKTLLAFIGILFLLNCGIEKLKTIDLSATSKKVIILDNSINDGEVIPQPPAVEALPYVEPATNGEAEASPAVQENKVEEEIKKVFGEQACLAIAIAKCESKLETDRIGDGHLAFDYNGETLGESIGVFQIRTGGKEKNGNIWSRPKALGMTVEQFKNEMKDYKKNIEYAKQIFDRSGNFGKWTCYTDKGYLSYL